MRTARMSVVGCGHLGSQRLHQLRPICSSSRSLISRTNCRVLSPDHHWLLLFLYSALPWKICLLGAAVCVGRTRRRRKSKLFDESFLSAEPSNSSSSSSSSSRLEISENVETAARRDTEQRTAAAAAAGSIPLNWLNSSSSKVLYCACLYLLLSLHVQAFDCDFTRISSGHGGLKNGTFAAPILNGHYFPPTGIQCIYTFVALPSERVKISFKEFNLIGRPPECLHEYIDLYTELRNSSEDLVETDKFGGRFCGKIAPRARISLHNTIVLVFSSNRNLSGAQVFSGTYEFINASIYQTGTLAPLASACGYVVKSWVKRLGDFVSPTYPGVYPQRIMCSYQLIGQRGQRVRVEFMDFDLFFGGSHCPYDRLTIYDGSTEQDPIINTYCGPQRNLVVFSSEENLFITFITNRSGGENRGFHAIFEFSELFVNLEFITGEHVRGSDCDQRILSHGLNRGAIKSPNSPFPYLPNVECRYLIEGLNNAEDLERVRVRFDKFHMPQILGANKGDCSAGGLFIWLDGKESGQPHRSFCGTNLPVEQILSQDSKILIKFISGSTQGLGFIIVYEFETYFGVPGTPHPISTTCEFRFKSSSKRSGDFHSPRHPANYPSNNNCTYIFEGQPSEQTHVEFDIFKLSGTGISYAMTCNHQDHVDLYEFSERKTREIGRYCGLAAPAPIKTRAGLHSVKMHFVTDATGVTNGFRGRYWFTPENSLFSPKSTCGGLINNATHGVIQSPNYSSDRTNKYPPNADCEWEIVVLPGHNVLLNFTYFSLEGNQTANGCPGAALKIYTDPEKYPHEVCGDKDLSTEYRSHGRIMKLIFISASKATGAAGFEAIWTEFHHPVNTECEEEEFLCEQSLFCISRELVCDGQYNCGERDSSDESEMQGCELPQESSVFQSNNLLGIVLGGVGLGVLVLLIVMGLFCCRKKRVQRRSRKRQQQHETDWNN